MTFTPKSEFVQILIERGFVQDCSDFEALDKTLSTNATVAYVGYDATAKSLHVGNLLNVMMLRWFQKCGHKPITLMGGGTTKIGDPSFRSDERPLLSIAEIEANIISIQTVFKRYLSYETGKNAARMVNNSVWLDELNYLDFLRTIGTHFSVNRMLSFESVKSRLTRDQSLSFLEFNYMILQAYDFLELSRRFNCELQMGGSDQWGNIVNGIDLTRRVIKKNVFGLTSPLITTASGQKMGKSKTGAVWLNENLTSPYDFWQFWRNTEDKDVGKFLRMYTELPMEECIRMDELAGAEINHAKEILATEVTKLCHGKKAAEDALITAGKVFRDKSFGDALPTLTMTQQEILGISIVQLFLKAGLGSSGKEIKRLIADGGAKLNDSTITDTNLKFKTIAAEETIKLSAGKKRHVLVKVSPKN